MITGVEMFVHQGARQFEIWTGKPAPEEEMLRVVAPRVAPTGKDFDIERHQMNFVPANLEAERTSHS